MFNPTLKALLLLASLLVLETSAGPGLHDQGFVTGALSAEGGNSRFSDTRPEQDDVPPAVESNRTFTLATAPSVPVAGTRPQARTRPADTPYQIRAPPACLTL